MKILGIEVQSRRLRTLFFAAILLALLPPVLTSCTADAQPAAQEQRIVRADRWYVPEHELPRCGARIQPEDVVVVDLVAIDYDAATLEAQIGAFEQITDKPVAVSSKGSREDVEQRVRLIAAGRGCDVVLLGPVQSETGYGGWGAMSPGTAGGKEEVSYQLLRMGYRTD